MNRLRATEDELRLPRCPVYPDRPRAWWVEYAVAIAVIAGINVLVALLDPHFPNVFFRMPMVLAIGVIGYLYGFGPFIVALVLGIGSYLYVQFPPRYAIWPIIATPPDLADFSGFTFGATAAGITLILIRRNRQRIQRLANDLAEKEAVLDAFFSQSPVTLAILDMDLRLFKVNPYTAGLLGRPAKQLEGRLMSEIAPDFEARFGPKLRRLLETGETENNVMISGELPGEPGVIGHWLFSHFPISIENGKIIGLGMIGVDITDLVYTEEALKRSEERFRTVFDLAGIGMTVIDVNGTVLAANPAFAEFVGYDQVELVGMNVEQFAYPEDAPAANKLLMEMLEGNRESFQSEKRYVKKDGSIVWGRLTASIYRGHEPEPPFIIGMIEDITARVKAVTDLLEEQQHKMEFYRRTIMAATEGKLIITEPKNVEALDGRIVKIWKVEEPSDLQSTRHEASNAALELGLDDFRASQYATAVGEAVTNAIKHAGGGTASIRRTDETLIFIVSDEGPGIEALSLPAVALERGYTTAGTLGMGFKLMMELSDKVYLATGPEGTTVGIEIGLQPKVDAVLAPFVNVAGMDD